MRNGPVRTHSCLRGLFPISTKQKNVSFQEPRAATEMACPPEARKLNSAYKKDVHVHERLQFGPKTGHTFVLFKWKLLTNHAVLTPLQSSWDNYKGSPMLELWKASTRNLGEPHVPD